MPKSWRVGLVTLCWVALSFNPAAALQVTIQDTVLTTQGPGDQCILIGGEYRGLRIEPNRAGRRAKICYDTIRQNLIVLTDSTFIALEPAAEIKVRFEHDFPPGPNRKVVAHVRMAGFFATATGVGVSTGSTISLDGNFNQSGNSDPISDGLDYSVGEDVDSGIFKAESRERYLAAGERSLSGEMQLLLVGKGDKLVLPVGVQVDVQPVARIQEKFEEAEEGLDADYAPISLPPAEPGF